MPESDPKEALLPVEATRDDDALRVASPDTCREAAADLAAVEAPTLSACGRLPRARGLHVAFDSAVALPAPLGSSHVSRL